MSSKTAKYKQSLDRIERLNISLVYNSNNGDCFSKIILLVLVFCGRATHMYCNIELKIQTTSGLCCTAHFKCSINIAIRHLDADAHFFWAWPSKVTQNLQNRFFPHACNTLILNSDKSSSRRGITDVFSWHF